MPLPEDSGHVGLGWHSTSMPLLDIGGRDVLTS